MKRAPELLLLLIMLLRFAAQAQDETSPVILTQPQSTTVIQGQSVNLYVAAGGGAPLYYQWYFDGLPIAGQNGTNLSMMGVAVSATGVYYVAVTNEYGSVASTEAFLAVDGPPLIIMQPLPTNRVIYAGQSTTFNTGEGGVGPLHYQWLFNGRNVPDMTNIIRTVAGNGSAGYSGDGGIATNANLNMPAGVAVDAYGNVFIADHNNNVIRKVESFGTYGDYGVMTTVAGNGNAAYSGDGAAATNASLNGPTGVAVDVYGNLFIADQANNVIREVSTNGVITTVAGNGAAGYSGDGGTATNAMLFNPAGVVVDASGNLFIAEWSNNRVRKVSTNAIITTVAGNGASGSSGNGGAATNAELYGPLGVAVDANGNLFIADTGNNVIREVNINGIISTAVGNGRYGPPNNGGAATNSNLYYPYGIAVDALGNLFIANRGDSTIEEVNTSGILRTVAGISLDGRVGSYSGDGGPATSAYIYFPAGVAVDANGNLFIADTGNNRVREAIASVAYPTLTLNNVTLNNVGSYQLIVTNAFGSVTSSVATLALVTAPLIVNVSGYGTITTNYNGLSLPVGAAYSMTATPDNGYIFFRWIGSQITNAATIKFTVASNLTFTSVFANPTNPPIAIDPGLSGQLTVSWPAVINNFVLQTNANLSSTDWVNYAGNLETNGTTEYILISANVTNLFFRLKH
jgi:sugar lactone lactonase YvrE